jgi:hypothetical protein
MRDCAFRPSCYCVVDKSRRNHRLSLVGFFAGISAVAGLVSRLRGVTRGATIRWPHRFAIAAGRVVPTRSVVRHVPRITGVLFRRRLSGASLTRRRTGGSRDLAVQLWGSSRADALVTAERRSGGRDVLQALCAVDVAGGTRGLHGRAWLRSRRVTRR